MVGDNSNRWTAEVLARMAQLRAENVAWKEIAREIGHPTRSCMTIMSKEKRRHLREARNVERHKLRAAADLASEIDHRSIFLPKVKQQMRYAAAHPIAKPADLTDYARSSFSTALLVADAELRARIEILGVTGGLFGDPLPGRSALDEKRAAERSTR